MGRISSLSQALSIKHTVQGCLEGVFAQGQVLGIRQARSHVTFRTPRFDWARHTVVWNRLHDGPITF